jgi:hypothetical protein
MGNDKYRWRRLGEPSNILCVASPQGEAAKGPLPSNPSSNGHKNALSSDRRNATTEPTFQEEISREINGSYEKILDRY